MEHKYNWSNNLHRKVIDSFNETINTISLPLMSKEAIDKLTTLNNELQNEISKVACSDQDRSMKSLRETADEMNRDLNPEHWSYIERFLKKQIAHQNSSRWDSDELEVYLAKFRTHFSKTTKKPETSKEKRSEKINLERKMVLNDILGLDNTHQKSPEKHNTEEKNKKSNRPQKIAETDEEDDNFSSFSPISQTNKKTSDEITKATANRVELMFDDDEDLLFNEQVIYTPNGKVTNNSKESSTKQLLNLVNGLL